MNEKGITPKREPLVFMWIWTIGWCAISFPGAFLVWSQPDQWAMRLFIIPFVLIGLGSLYYTVRMQRNSLLSRGAELVLSNQNPRAGESLLAELLLPSSFMRSDWLKQSALSLQLVQYEEDRSSSGVSLILSHALEQTVHPEQLPDGSWRLAARFDIPSNAPATGAVRHGNTVLWQIELHETKQAELIAFKLQMRAAAQPAMTWSEAPLHQHEALGSHAELDKEDEPASASRWPVADEGERRFHLQQIAALDLGEQPGAVAHSIARLEENTALWRAVFPRTAWRVWSVFLVAASVATLGWARNLWHTNAGFSSLAEGFALWLLACGLIIASLHAWTKRWHLVVRDEGFAVDKSSALFKKVQEFGAAQAHPLRYNNVYQTSGAGQARVWHFSAVMHESAQSRKIAITPSLPGAAACAAVVHHFWHALAHRRLRFAAQAEEVYSGLGPSALQRLSAWMLALLVISLFLIVVTLSPKTQWIDVLKPSVVTGQVSQQLLRLHPKNILYSRKRDALLKAHRANLPEQLAQALSNGADANALDDDGMPLLIDAARTGHLEIVRTYLQHGANVNIQHTANSNNHGDTALLVALYRGHWDVAQTLIASGADLQAKNRWDWGAMHMAAQSDCIPCLKGLLDLGFSPNTPAPASRGESPVMLAAGKGKLLALQWLTANGGNLTQKDPQGQNALAWAEFFNRKNTADWIRAELHSIQVDPIKN